MTSTTRRTFLRTLAATGVSAAALPYLFTGCATARPRPRVTGRLRPSFKLPVGNYGLRYVLINPLSGAVAGYVEFDSLSTGIDPAGLVGKYVSVTGDVIRDERIGLRVIRGSQVTVLGTVGREVVVRTSRRY